MTSIAHVPQLPSMTASTSRGSSRQYATRWPEIHALDPRRFDERFRRVWRTYLVSCAAMFRSSASTTHLFQVTFAKGNVDAQSYPMNRRAYYEEGR